MQDRAHEPYLAPYDPVDSVPVEQRPPPLPPVAAYEQDVQRTSTVEEEVRKLADMVREGQRCELALMFTLVGATSTISLLGNAVSQLEPQDWKRLKPTVTETLVAARALVAKLEPICAEPAP